MAEGCNIPHPLKREGTFQFERFPLALDKEYVKIDERNINALLNQSIAYSNFVKYINEQNSEDGKWTEFFDNLYVKDATGLKTTVLKTVEDLEKESQTSPHLALFIAFLKLFGIAQDNQNTLTKRHLDFYYQTFLQLRKLKETPDRVAIFFDPEKNTDQVKVPEGTLLPAGKDKTGKPLYYATDSELIVNQAQLAELRTIYVNKKQDATNTKLSLHASADAYTQNKVSDNDTAGITTFGSKQNDYANIGFAIASPIFNLKEGRRRITLQINGIDNINRSALIVEYTSAKGWTTAELDNDPQYQSLPYNKKYFLIKIDPGLAATSPYNETIHQAKLSTIHPVIRFRIKNDVDSEATFHATYSALKSIVANQVQITVGVDGVKTLILQNDLGPVDGSKPFPAFGPNPVKSRSTLYIGHYEAFNKYLQSFNLAISWKGLPNNIRKHYATYNDGLELMFPVDSTHILSYQQTQRKKYFDTNQFSSFEPGHPPGELSILDQGKWKNIHLNKLAGYPGKIYNDPYRHLSKTHDYWQNVYKNKALPDGNVSSDYSYDQAKTYGNDVKSGFIKIELGYDFGHAAYQNLYVQSAIHNAKNPDLKQFPEKPYTPEFNSLHLDYTSATTVDFSANPENQFFHVHPFGSNEINDNHHPLIPEFESEGNLLLGLKNISKPEVVSVYFQLEKNTGNIDKAIDDTNAINWYYLVSNHWVKVQDSQIVENTTNKFTGSGLIKFNLPKDVISSHSILTNGLVWIKASVDINSDAYPNVVLIRTQAIEAVFENNDNETSHLEDGIVPNTISKLQTRITGIKKAEQPFESYGGRMAEQDEQFYTRISERLRHKNRSWSIWDHERMVLQNFPAVFKAKCISHANTNFEYAPSNVYMVLLPYISNVDYTTILTPRVSLSTIEQVKESIQKTTSAFAKIVVSNPVYETIKVTAQVKLRKEFADISYYQNKLIEDIKGFIAPWSILKDAKLSFEGKIYKSQIINFIEEREYVDYITAFDVVKHTYDNKLITCEELITGSKENNIITSETTHLITAF
jgi:Baseplate J-like protein